MRNDDKIKLKRKIYLSRTYRRLRVDRVSQNLYLFLWVVPCLIIFLYTYTDITFILAKIAQLSLLSYLTTGEMEISYSDFFPYFGGVYYLGLPDSLPDNGFIVVNLSISLIVFLVCVGVFQVLCICEN